MFQDLQAPEGTAHPILQVDAIRFLNTFRNQVRFCSRNHGSRTHSIQIAIQLTKDQLLMVLPHLAQHLRSRNYVVYTYAAVTIERILFTRDGAILR